MLHRLAISKPNSRTLPSIHEEFQLCLLIQFAVGFDIFQLRNYFVHVLLNQGLGTEKHIKLVRFIFVLYHRSLSLPNVWTSKQLSIANSAKISQQTATQGIYNIVDIVFPFNLFQVAKSGLDKLSIIQPWLGISLPAIVTFKTSLRRRATTKQRNR